MNHDQTQDENYVPRVEPPDGAAERVRDGVLEEANRIVGDTWQDEQGVEHPYTEPTPALGSDLTLDDLGIEASGSPDDGMAAPVEKPKRGRGRRQAPNPDTHKEVPNQDERAGQAIMELGVYDGRQVDRREVKFSGAGGLSAFHPEGVELWHSMKGGRRVVLTIVGTIGAHGHRYTTDKEGDVIEVIATRALKIDVIQLRELHDSTEGLPLFEEGERNGKK